MVSQVAKALTGLDEPIVFVGGALVEVYQDDVATAPSRPTDDVDCIVRLAAQAEFWRLEEKLRMLGFSNDTNSKVICRWTLGELTVDVMPTDTKILGFTNRWYEPGFRLREERTLSDGTTIFVMPLLYFIASKFEALMDRGSDDWRFEPDLEDILLVLDGSTNPLQKLTSAEEELRAYLAACGKTLLARRDLADIFASTLGDLREERAVRLRSLFSQLSAAMAGPP